MNYKKVTTTLPDGTLVDSIVKTKFTPEEVQENILKEMIILNLNISNLNEVFIQLLEESKEGEEQ